MKAIGKLGKRDIEQLLLARFVDDSCNSLKDLPKPHLLKDIKKASTRIARAIKEREKITIVGDYDVDGVISSVVMSEFFDDIGYPIDLIIPNRFKDGYGINEKLLDRIKADLIITVDNGISADKAAKICKDRGIDLIITDHHNIPETLPDAFAIINPKQEDCNFPHKQICGAQVAWYLIATLKDELGLKNYNLAKFLDLLALAIVADMMELKGLNRVMVKAGFKMINQESRVIFSAIKNYFNKSNFTSDDISFLLSPIINSAGRMEDATLAYEMLRSGDFVDATKKLSYIVSLNDMRKLVESELYHLAIQEEHSKDSVVVVWGDGWHEGVIGIVAARLCRHFKKPSIVLSVKNGKAKGSARSVGEVDILSLIASQKDLLLGYGGHKSAAGLAIEESNLEKFKDAINILASKIPEERYLSRSDIVGEIDVDEIDLELVNILEKFEPYGMKNPKPKFIIKNAYIEEHKVLGVEQNHLKMRLRSGNNVLNSIYFNFKERAREGEHIDLVCSIGKNEFRGDMTIQLIVDDILKA